jgi:serine/threonine-protein kinase SMG1
VLQTHLVDCISKIGFFMMTNRNPNLYFDWTLDKVSIHLNDNEMKNTRVKICLIKALQQNINEDSAITKSYLNENTDYILINLKKVIETIETPDLMVELTRTILLLSYTFHDSFFYNFQDLADILIAWHIDTSLTDNLIEFISDTLVKFRPYWLRNMNFTITLLFQFVEDLESYTKTFTNDQKYEQIEKIAALFRVYTTVVDSICPIDEPKFKLTTNQVQKYNEQLLDSFKRLLMCACCISSITNCAFTEMIFRPVNKCIHSFYDSFEDVIFYFDNLLKEYLLNHNNKRKEPLSYQTSLSYLDILIKLHVHYAKTNDIDFFTQILSLNGNIWRYKLTFDAKLIDTTIHFYKTLIFIKCVPIAQEVYNHLLIDTQIAFNNLLKKKKSEWDAITIVTHQLDETAQIYQILKDETKAEKIILFNLCILTELGNAKNNLICMYGLSPRLFDILTQQLMPMSWKLLLNSRIQFSIFETLHSHCQRHDHFIATSSLFIVRKNDEKMMFTNNTQSGDNFEIIIDLLIKVLSHQATPLDLTMASLNWTNEIINLLPLSNLNVNHKLAQFFNSIINTAVLTTEMTIFIKSGHILINLLNRIPVSKFPPNIPSRLYYISQMSINSSNLEAKNNAFNLIKLIPINVSTNYLKPHHLNSLTTNSQTFFIQKSADTMLSIYNFRQIMGYILSGLSPTNDFTWLHRIFHCSQHREVYQINIQPCENNLNLIWFWALWECGQFFIQSKLKTPIGKAQDGFIAIEDCIKDYFFMTSNNDGDNWIENRTRLNLLVQFMEYLEKLIYNAYEGTAVSLQPVSKVNLFLFF